MKIRIVILCAVLIAPTVDLAAGKCKAYSVDKCSNKCVKVYGKKVYCKWSESMGECIASTSKC